MTWLKRLHDSQGVDIHFRTKLAETLRTHGQAAALRFILECVKDDGPDQPAFDADLVKCIHIALQAGFQRACGSEAPQELAAFVSALRAACLAELRDSAGPLLADDGEPAAHADGTPLFTDRQRTAHARLAVLWTKLGRRQDQALEALCWQPSEALNRPELIDAAARRMLPDGAAAEAVERLREPLTLAAAAQRCLGPSYEVLFPVVWNDQGYLLRARMTLLHDASLPAGGPLLHAPWSVWRLLPGDAVALGQRLPAAFRTMTEVQDAATPLFLLELRDPEVPELAPPPLWVEGQSLGLAVLLAAWAARRHRHLHRMAVTGEIDESGGWVERVTAVPLKFEAFVKYVRAVSSVPAPSPLDRPGTTDRRWRFLVPVGDGLPDDPQVSVVEVGRLKDLREQEAHLLTDGFDDYREALLTAVADWKATLLTTS